MFIVDSLTVDPGCDMRVKPQHGHLLVVTMRAELGAASGSEMENDSAGFTGQFWTAFTPLGGGQEAPGTANALGCFSDAHKMPYAAGLEAGTVYSRKVALDVSTPTGTVVLLNSLDGGWAYQYG